MLVEKCRAHTCLPSKLGSADQRAAAGQPMRGGVARGPQLSHPVYTCCVCAPCAPCQQVVEAFDVLINEEQRAVYDKCRDYQVC